MTGLLLLLLSLIHADTQQLAVSSNRICVFDGVQLRAMTEVQQVRIEVLRLSADQALPSPPSSQFLFQAVHTLPRNYDCSRLFVDSHCGEFKAGTLSHSIQNNAVLIRFKYETAMPAIQDYQELRQWVVFSPPPNSAISPIWLSPTELRILFDDESTLPPHDVHIAWNDSLLNQSSAFTQRVRFTEVGLYQLYLKDNQSEDTIASSDLIEVIDCPSDLVVPPHSNFLDDDYPVPMPETPPRREFRILGPLALTGDESAKVGHRSLSSLQSDEFSISFWIRLMEPPTGNFRTIFFKGDTSGQRHPSMWLLPHANRFTIRTSTASNVDVGAESKIEVPLNKWTHVVVNFENTVSQVNKSHAYEIGLFVNGHKDTSFLFQVSRIFAFFRLMTTPRTRL